MTMNYFAGVSVPVFSLRSDDSFGIGEFNDLKKLADWCVMSGLKLIQILPVNDTTTDGGWNDSYPYKSMSTKTLHPIYLNLEKVGILKDENERLRFNEKKKELNAKEFVDYPEVFKAKMEYLRKIFNYQNDFKDFYDFLQYHCDKQFTEAVDYLHSKGVMLKGDLPIGVNRDSDDVKQNPQLFNLDMETGAPPDAFAAEGQNWGFPTYNWDEMAKDDFAWWRSRVKWLERYFDALRIDHILGFFRIWEIPKGSPNASFGHYSPTDPIRWEIEGRNRLSRIFGNSKLLICGEDLGMVAPCVPGVMRELGILSLEVQRMPKSSSRPFSDPRENPYLSVDTTGTHDMPTIRGWWEEDRELSARFYHEMLHHDDGAPYFCEPYICKEIIGQHMHSASQWVIIPIQDYIAMDGDFRWDCTWEEQINKPADPNHRWRYRMHQSLEQLLGNERLNTTIKELSARHLKNVPSSH
ncbi:MAG: 4-alpha-glucanotransferase [Bacteroidales bacterium]|nr:4-alpha-glucanotransferase [Bacteroidales bacterium]